MLFYLITKIITTEKRGNWVQRSQVTCPTSTADGAWLWRQAVYPEFTFLTTKITSISYTSNSIYILCTSYIFKIYLLAWHLIVKMINIDEWTSEEISTSLFFFFGLSLFLLLSQGDMRISNRGIFWLFPEDPLLSVMMWNRDHQSTETLSIPHAVWVKTKGMPHFQEPLFLPVFVSVLNLLF